VQRYDERLPFAVPSSLRVAGIVVGVAGALLAASSIVTFIWRGRGTPAPFDPPRDFVASGPYRYTRNPMYLGAAAVLLGAGLIVASPAIVVLAGFFLLVTHFFVLLYEEPTLTSRFGESYQRYRATVNRWWPRLPAKTASPEGRA
jgi:protein-S-isoprenylcysteine O-methyltransferase Ste14